MTNTARLSAKVNAQNKANQKVREIAPLYLAALAPFVGQQIYKADGAFLKKVTNVLPKGEAGDYFNSGSYSLSRVVRVSAPVIGREGCEYMQSTVYLGNLDNGILTELSAFVPENFRIDYTVEEIVKAREELALAQKAVSAAQSKLCTFGEYDC